jgi:ABC-type nitrate/sulfonate/bicarbonate transport system substrate-binding protein
MLELDKEIQARHGLEFTTVDFKGNVTGCIAAVISGEVDVCQNGISIGMNAIAQGGDLVAFMQLIGQINEITLTPDAIARIGVGPEASVGDRIAALKGLTIAGPGAGSTTYSILEAILAEAGLAPADLVYQPLTDITALNASLSNKRIDAAIWSVGGLSPAQSDGSGLRYINLASGEIPHLLAVPNVASFAPRKFVEDNREALQRVQAAFVDVVAALRADPFGYAAPYKAAYLPDLPQATWEDNLPQAVAAYFADVEGSREGWDFWVKHLPVDDPAARDRVAYDAAYDRLSQ